MGISPFTHRLLGDHISIVIEVTFYPDSSNFLLASVDGSWWTQTDGLISPNDYLWGKLHCLFEVRLIGYPDRECSMVVDKHDNIFLDIIGALRQAGLTTKPD